MSRQKTYSDIVQTILAGDAQGAAQALRAHVMVQGERFGDLLASLSNIELQAA